MRGEEAQVKDISGGCGAANGMPKEWLPGRNLVSRVDREWTRWTTVAHVRVQSVAQGRGTGGNCEAYHLNV